MFCLGCDHVAIELGSCCCAGADESGDEQPCEGNEGPVSPFAPTSCDSCADLVFKLEEAPVLKISHDPAPAMAAFDLPALSFGNPHVTEPFHLSSRRPPDFNPPFRLLQSVRLLI